MVVASAGKTWITGRVNYLITYPRSGTTWMINRIKSLTDKRIRNSHFGFHPAAGIEGKGNRIKRIRLGDRLIVLLRDGRKSIVSMYYYLLGKVVHHDEDRLKDEGFMPDMSLEEYVRSPYGAERFASYLNRLQSYKESGYDMIFCYYEDIQGPGFIYEIPSLLGLDYAPTEETVERVHKDNLRMVNMVGADHSKANEELLNYIQDTLKEQCLLREYEERYLG